MVKTVVEVRSLVKKYGNLTAVDDVSFELYEGEVFAFLGPNGAGKTTTVEILECLRPLTSGEARVFGYDVTKRDDVKEIKKRIGVLPQDYSALDKLSVKENIDLIGGMYACIPVWNLLAFGDYANLPAVSCQGTSINLLLRGS